jgi:uncharacterized membrane protein (UPF0136 family)
MLKKSICWTVLVYGISMIVLGAVGYLFYGSFVSSIAGGGFGILLILSAYLMFKQNRAGLYAASAFTLLLTATFSVRYTLSQKPIPAILAVISGGMLLFLFTQVTKKQSG